MSNMCKPKRVMFHVAQGQYYIKDALRIKSWIILCLIKNHCLVNVSRGQISVHIGPISYTMLNRGGDDDDDDTLNYFLFSFSISALNLIPSHDDHMNNK